MVQAAIEGIASLLDSSGNAINSNNITDGIPNQTAIGNNNTDMSSTPIGSQANAVAILTNKAKSLLDELTAANQPGLATVLQTLSSSPSSTTPDLTPLQHWLDGLNALFQGHGLPANFSPLFNQTNESHTVTSVASSFSPVFPVSDARGYEHFGSFQYGRGLSIEPGGNYEQIMSSDPFANQDPALIDRLVRAISISRLTRDSNGNIQLTASIQQTINEIAGDQTYANSQGGQIALRWAENSGVHGDRTTMIAAGLANYLMSDRDSVTKLPVNNAAFNLTDLQPQGQQDTCSCRGAESDLLLAAYMAGVDSQAFIDIDNPTLNTTLDPASQWVQQVMLQASGSWSLAQQAMRGMGSGSSGRRSLLDSVSGWQQLGSQVSSAVNNPGATTQFQNQVSRLNQESSQASTQFRQV